MSSGHGLTVRVAAGFSTERFPQGQKENGHELLPLPPEAERIVADDEEPSAAQTALLLLELPRHLLGRWFRLLESTTLDAGFQTDGPQFDRLAQATIEFLQFKQCRLPSICVCRLELRRGTAAASDIALPAGPVSYLSEPHSLAFNLGPERAQHSFAHPGQPVPEAEGGAIRVSQEATPIQSWDHFRQRWPGFPVLDLTLQPGQGILLPASALAYDRGCGENGQPAVWLLIAGRDTT